MSISAYIFRALPAALACTLSLSACSPQYDWREVHGSTAPFTVLMPSKPSSYTRPVDLGHGMRVTMTMTGARAGDMIFAVGNATLPDAAMAPAALQAMKAALVRNIGGTVTQDAPVSSIAGADQAIAVEALGAPARGSSGKRALSARFVAKGPRVYQIVAVGPERGAPREQIDTFLTSFKPE